MSLTFTIGTTDFLAISTTSGRQALDIEASPAIQDQKRFRVPGIEGQAICRAGNTGRRIMVRARYMADTIGDALAMWEVDTDAWGQAAVAIVVAGIPYAGCNLDTGASRRVSPIRPTGRNSGQVFFDVVMNFTQDNPTNGLA